MSDLQFINHFGETLTAKIENDKLVFYHSDDLFEKHDMPLQVITMMSGYNVINAQGVFAVVDEDELKRMVTKYIEFISKSMDNITGLVQEQ